jgi:hypothetical protein
MRYIRIRNGVKIPIEDLALIIDDQESIGKKYIIESNIHFIDNDGKVYSIAKYKKENDIITYNVKEKICNIGKAGYKQVHIKIPNKSKMYTVHRLVAKYFVPNPNKYNVVHHIDGNKLNNNYKNLEWTTQSQNIKYCSNSGDLYRSRVKKLVIENDILTEYINLKTMYWHLKEITINKNEAQKVKYAEDKIINNNKIINNQLKGLTCN